MEKDLTQKQMADRLFVSDSAVSKWERGISYPDITLVSDICALLDISEKELLMASEDTQARTLEKYADKYIRLVNTYKYTLLIAYGLALLTCFIVNLAVSHTLSWFFIVLFSIAVAFSLTLVPVLVTKHKGLITLGSFTLSLFLLLLVCNIYTGGNWFLLTVVCILFGLSLVFLPFLLQQILHKNPFKNHKTLIYFAFNSLFLLLMLAVINGYDQGNWFLTSALPGALFSLILPWAMMVVIRYTKINGFFLSSACLGLTAAFYCFAEGVYSKIFHISQPASTFAFDFRNWGNNVQVNNNVNAIILFSILFLTLAFAVAGIVVALRKKK